jgi:hypothetical protein
MKRLTLALGLLALIVTAAPLSAAHVRGGGGFRGGTASRGGTAFRGGTGFRGGFRGGNRGPGVFFRYRPSFWGWGYWYDPFWYDPWYRPYPGYYGYGYGGGYGYGSGYGDVRSSDWAIIDTDVSPESARVYLDGQYIGTADDFDGFPDYLYLRRGHYRLEFRLDGYQTRTIEVDARPGVKINVDDKLAKIPGAPHYGSYEESPPPGGIRRYWAKRGNATEPWSGEDERYGSVTPRYRERPRDLDDSERYSDDRDRDRDRDGDRDREEAIEREHESDRPPADSRQWRDRRQAQHGDTWVRLTVEPSDAAIYLDDRFVGTASELDAATGFAVSPGKHTLVVSRPGYRDRRVALDVSRGKTERLDIRLEH